MKTTMIFHTLSHAQFIKRITSQRTGITFNIAAFALFSLTLIGCAIEDTPSSQRSIIYPASLLIENLQPIKQISPNNGTTYYIDDRIANDLVFKFEGNTPYYASVILFKNQPNVSKEGYIIDGNAQCLGGVTNMTAVHPWNGFSSVLSATLTSSVFYTCNSNATTDIFSTTDKLILDESTFPKGAEIYWAVLGYNKRYTLTHSSSLRKINIE